MLYYTLGQWAVFLGMVPAGYAAGAWYGLSKSVAALMIPGPVLRAVCDAVNAFGVCLIITAGLLATCYGEIRLYPLLGAGAGFALERATLGVLNKAARSACARICKLIRGRQEKRKARRIE